MKKVKNYFFVFVCFFSIVSSINAVYWGLSYQQFGVDGESLDLLGGKTYTMLPYNEFGVGAGGYVSLQPTVNPTEYSGIQDEIYLQFVGVSVLKKFYVGGVFEINIVPNVFYGSGNIFIQRKNKDSGETISNDNSTFTIIEPGVDIELSLSDALLLETGLSISSIYDTQLENYTDEDFVGLTFSISIIFNPESGYLSDLGNSIGTNVANATN